MLSQAYRLGRITMAIATTMAKKCRDSDRISVRKIRQIFRIIPPLYIVLRSLRNLICTDKITLVLYWFPGKCPSLLGFVSENLQFFLVTRKSGGNDCGGVAFGNILFASSGKKYAKNAAKTKVLEIAEAPPVADEARRFRGSVSRFSDPILSGQRQLSRQKQPDFMRLFYLENSLSQ